MQPRKAVLAIVGPCMWEVWAEKGPKEGMGMPERRQSWLLWCWWRWWSSPPPAGGPSICGMGLTAPSDRLGEKEPFLYLFAQQ